ncbi:hypothetical protein LSUE1_G004127 [Lachnellula suecica]|uniref:Uncharacterized protein n=1 Tax=Lachnellula suecica TaxID=602035 RepID=A0A8T9C3W8_9HELO|nr:hypothetical protein LSUE1_G004127 [Lachnellula suecica]
MSFHLFGRESPIPAVIPKSGQIVYTVLSVVTVVVLAVCLTRRVLATESWKMPLTRWLIFAIYADSIIFIVSTMVLELGFGLNSSEAVCRGAIYLCLACYMTTKIIYYFLVEKVYIIRRVQTTRLKSKLYLFNCFGMLLPYCGVVILNFVYRIAYINESGTCIIGMEIKAMLPLIIFDALLYLTLLFVIPLRSLYSYQNSPNSLLRTISLRSFVGSLATLTSSVVNLTILMILKGEAAWICLTCCNADILFSVLVLHWVTSKDSSSIPSGYSRSNPSQSHRSRNKLGAFSVYGKGNTGLGTVTTHISASRNGGQREKEDMGDMEMGGITVQVGQVVEIEVEREGGENGEGRRSHKSTEDLVERL